MYVSGVRVCNWGNTAADAGVRHDTVGTCSAIIPPGATYFVTAWGGSVWFSWSELR
jgi:hypothetical protein